MTQFRSGRIAVSGQVFLVRASDNVPGQHDLTWSSGPNPGYGFTHRRSDGQLSSERELVEAAQDFLDHVDPATGHLD